MDLQLAGKVALVTGSSKGIGEAVAKGLAQEGATVLVHGRDRTQADRVDQQIRARGGKAHVVIGDMTVDDDVHALVEKGRTLIGRIDIVVNNAGGSGGGED